MKSFADLGVSPGVVSALAKRGVEKPFPVQSMVVADAIGGNDLLVRSPTGSGKTLAFGVPLVERTEANMAAPAALVLAPTRELVRQIVDELSDIARVRSLRICAVYGGVGIQPQIRDVKRSHIIVATPGRLEDLLQRGSCALGSVRTLVLDEADRMLDMGFRPAVDRIVRACPKERQTLFFSATLDGLAGEIAASYTRNALVRNHAPDGSNLVKSVEHRFVRVQAADRLETLIAELGRERENALVFVRTKRGADRLAKRLGRAGVDALAIHGDRSQRQRELALSRFQSGHTDVLVATDVAARGIDVDAISHVINYDPPDSHDTYIHRIGRTGRAGRGGVGITLVSDAESGDMRKLAGRLGIADGLGGADPRRKQGRSGAPDRHGRPRRRSKPGAGRRAAAASASRP